MRIIDLIKMGLRNLFRRKARTVLTVLGVVIGTISIMLMVSIGYGINYNFRKSVMENGAMTMITIYAQTWSEESDDLVQQKIDDALIEAIREIEHVKACTGVKIVNGSLNSGKYHTYAQITAMDKETFEAFGFPALAIGTYPNEADNTPIIYGSDTLGDFYYFSGNNYKSKTVDPAKDKIYLTFDDYATPEGKTPYKYVIKNYGVFEPSDNYMYSYNCYMDMDFYKEIYKKYIKTLDMKDRKAALKKLEVYDKIMINCDSMDYVTKVQDEIKEMGFRTESDMQYVEESMKTSNMLQGVLGAIGAVSFLVAAINITNTMIMSIYERTKEIGIMKVLGCYIRDIKRLFLFEAGIIGFIGGTLGVALSYLASWAINKYGGAFLGSLFGGGEMGMKFCMIPAYLPALSIVGAVVVGVLSGYMPAARATKISAIEAMKNEG
ncbi:MAG: ABC transporter permease [Lachnospiraceae bacterium]|nr:ABC transporter permease [Lachnospiraceae bacterium]